MSTIDIAVDGNSFFTWEGDEVSAKRILKEFPRAAKHVGLSPEAFADNTVVALRKGSLLSENPAGREMQMMGVIWRILTAKTGNAEHPGKVRDYVGNTDFDVNIEIKSQTAYTLHVNAQSRLNS
jgi:hypothetical protein